MSSGNNGSRPIFKTDLIVSSNGLYATRSESTVIKDPGSNRYFSVSQRELSVLRLCDGTKTVQEIAETFNQGASRPVSVASVERLIETMSGAGLLQCEPGDHSIRRNSGRSRGLLGKLVFLKLKTINPDRFLQKGLRYVEFFFSVPFVVLATTLIAAGILLVTFNWSHFQGPNMATITRWEVGVGWSICLGIAVLHELAHGFACKHWGGQVKSMGLLFLYFNPALYCDVSDSWLFAKRSQRLWTMAAGGFLESFIWSLVVLTGAYLPLTPSARRISNFVILFTGLKIIINLNPLIKLDGYYLLSDALALPNLRSKAFDYSRRLLKRCLFKSGKIPNVTRRESISLVLYCAMAGPFSLWLGVAMFWRGIKAIANHHWKSGWIVIAVLVVIVLEPLLAYVSSLRRRLEQS